MEGEWTEVERSTLQGWAKDFLKSGIEMGMNVNVVKIGGKVVNSLQIDSSGQIEESIVCVMIGRLGFE